MKVSKNALRVATHPHLFALVVGLIVNDAKEKIAAAAAPGITDNSTGTVAGATVAVNTANLFTYAGGATLSPRAAFNTAIAKVDNAIAVLATYLNAEGQTPLSLTPITLNATGVVAAAGTVPALDKALSGTDGTSTLR